MYQVGDTVDGEYEVLRVFTNGGMGVVYKVHHMDWDIDMAMKCPRAELFADEESKKSFIKECRTWMDMGIHPNIVTCLYVKSIDLSPAIFIEYADGGSLADLIRSGQVYSASPELALKRILDIAIQTARGLGFAHGKGYVHQDIKPANILMTRTGIAKVSDFGLSKASQSLSNHTRQSKQIDGTERSIVVSSGGCTPAYCSPEQILNRAITRRTDIWSWALMILEMIHEGIFWRFGAEASRKLDKLWGWQIFSSKVKKSSELLALLKECLNEDEGKRPHDFAVIERRLVAIYSAFFGPYPRHKPSNILLSAGALCNQIASYSALDEYGEDVFHKISQTVDELRKNVRWATWGEINLAVYWLKSGKRIAEVARILENAFRYSTSKEDQRWIVNFLLSVGKTSPQAFDNLNSALDNKLREWIRFAHASLRDSLYKFFTGVRHSTKPFAYRPLPFNASFYTNTANALEETEYGYLVGRADSQNGKCHVSVSVPKTQNDNSDEDHSVYIVKVTLNGESFVCEDERIPQDYAIRFITVDDNASFLSLWLTKGKYGEEVVCRHVICLEERGLCTYSTDYRQDEKWGRIVKIYQSGDARQLMTISECGECSVWINNKGNHGDGRNVCEINLKEYGLIPPEELLPNLRLEEGFEYEINDATGFKLMDFLAKKFGGVRRPCRIFLPDTSEEVIQGYSRGTSKIEAAATADKKGLFFDEARLLSEAIHCGVMPQEEQLARRHRIVTFGRHAVIRDVWQYGEKREHWENKFALFPKDGAPAFESFFSHHSITDGAFQHLIVLCPVSDSDFLAIPKDDNFRGGPVKAIARYHVNGRMPTCAGLCRDLTQVWEYRFNESEHRFDFRNDIAVKQDMLELRLRDNNKIVSLNLEFGTVIEDRKWEEKNNLSGFEEKLLGDNGRMSIVDVGWALILRDGASGHEEIILDYRTLPHYSWRWRWNILNWAFRACVSESGMAVAILTWNHRLLVYCVNSHRIVFDWRLPDGKYQDMCFDKTGRWLSILYDYQNVLTFQLLWDLPIEKGRNHEQ